MQKTTIDYQAIVQDALLTTVQKALRIVEENRGEIPGDHHFYISFKTGRPGVEIPEDYRKKFPDEMTIVLQNRFSNLMAGEKSFSVTLYFNNVPRTVVIPYDAITAFLDPSVDFSLQFTTENDELHSAQNEDRSSSESRGNVIPIDFGKR